MGLPLRLIQDGKLTGSANSFPEFAKPYAAAYLEIEAGRSADRPFYSSGSTGTPRALFFTQTQLELVAKRSISALSLASSASVLLALPLNSVAARMVLMRAFYGKHTVYLVPPRIAFWPPELPAHTFDFIPLTSAQALVCLDFPEANQLLLHAPCLLLGGSEIPKRLLAALLQRKIPALQSYGMTETLSHIALRKLDSLNPGPYTCISGKTELFYHSEDLLGIRDTELLSDPVLTEDRVELIGTNQLRILGRLGNVINMGGLKLQAEALESAIAPSIPEGIAYYVSAVPDADFGQVPGLSIEGTYSDSISLSAINSQLQRRERIRAIRFLPQFSRTETGKVIRQPFQENP